MLRQKSCSKFSCISSRQKDHSCYGRKAVPNLDPSLADRRIIYATVEKLFQIQLYQQPTGGSFMLRQKSCSKFRSITGRQKDYLCYDRKAVPNLDPSLADRRTIYATVEKLFQIQIHHWQTEGLFMLRQKSCSKFSCISSRQKDHLCYGRKAVPNLDLYQQPTEGSFMLRQKSCSKFRSITGRQKNYLCYGRKAVPNLDPSLADRRIIYATVEKLFQIQIHHWQTGGSFMLRQKSCSKFSCISSRQKDHSCYGRKAVPNLDPSLADRRIIYATVEKLFQIQLYQQPTGGSFMLRQKSCSKFRSITGRQKDYLCYDRKAVPNLDPSLADRRTIYATVEKLFQIQIHHWQTEGLFMLRQKSCSKFSCISSRQKDHLCYGRKAVPNLAVSVADRRIIYATVEKLFQIQIHHWQTGGSFMLRQKSCSKFSCISSRQKDHLCYGRKAVPNLDPSLADRRIIYATVKKLFQIQIHHWQTEELFMLRQKSCSKFRSITGRQEDHLCYGRKAVPNLDPSLADRRIIYASVEKLFQIQLYQQPTEGSFMLRQKSCSKFRSITGRQKNHLCYGRKAVPNLDPSLADRRTIYATVEKLFQIQIHHWQTEGSFMLRQKSCSKFRSITGRQEDHLCYGRKAVPNLDPSVADRRIILCYGRKAVPNLDPSLADRRIIYATVEKLFQIQLYQQPTGRQRIIYATVEKLFQIQIHHWQTEGLFMLRQKSCSKFRSITGRQKDYLCYGRKAVPNLDPSLADRRIIYATVEKLFQIQLRQKSCSKSSQPDRRIIYATVEKLFQIQLYQQPTEGSFMLRQKSCSKFRSITGRQKIYLCYGRKAVPNLDPSLADRRIIYATVEKLFQIQIHQWQTEGSFMLRQKSCSKFRSITGRQKDHLCYGRKAVPNLDPSLADRRIIYATVEKLFQIQIHHWQTGGSFMLRQKSCSKFSCISSRQKDHLCYGRKAVPNLDPSLADRRIIYATVEKLFQIQIHHWQTEESFMLRQKSCSKFRSITGRQKDYLCYGRKAVPNLDPSLADRRIIYATVEKLFQIQIHHWQTEGSFMLRQKSCSKFRSITGRQEDHLCYGRKAVPNLDPSLADRRIIYATVEKLFQIQIHHWQTEGSFMLRQKSCSKFSCISSRQKDHLCYGRKAVPNLDPSLADRRIIYATVEKLFQIQIHHWQTEGLFMLRQKSCSKFSCISSRQKKIQIHHWQTEDLFMLRQIYAHLCWQKSCSKFRSITGRQEDHLCYGRKAVPNLDPSLADRRNYLCYGRKAVPNLDPSLADRRIIYATVEKLFQIQIHHWQTEGLFMLRQKSCSKFRSITGRQEDHLCYGRKAVPNLDPSLADRRIQIHHWQTGGSFMLRQKSCSKFRSITGRQKDHLCYGRKAVPNLDPSLADRRIIYATVEKLFQIQIHHWQTEDHLCYGRKAVPNLAVSVADRRIIYATVEKLFQIQIHHWQTGGSFMLRQKSCSKFRSITGRQKNYLCYGRKAVPNLDPSLADRRIIYATVEKLFQIQIHHWQTGGSFMLRQKSCSKFSCISSRQKDHLCYGRKAVPNLDPSLADRRIIYATVEKLFQIQIHHWQTEELFMLRQKSCSKFRSITGRQEDHLCYGRKAVPNLDPSLADRRIIYATVEKLFQIQIHHWQTEGSFYATVEKLFQIQIHHWQTEGLFMLRQKSCSKFSCISSRQEDHLCYGRKAVPNLDPSLADRRIIYATVEKLFQIQIHHWQTEELFMLRQKSCSKFRSITGRQKDYLCYGRKAVPNLAVSVADRRIIYATVEKLFQIQIHHWQTEGSFMLRQKSCSKFSCISSRQKDHLCYGRKAVPNLDPSLADRRIIYATVEKLFQIQLYQQPTEESFMLRQKSCSKFRSITGRQKELFMLRQKSCSKFRSITGRQKDHLCYGRKAVPNLDPSLADRRIIYATVEKLFQIQLYQQPTEGSFMLRQKSCSKFRSITGRQKNYLCYGRKAVPNLAVSVADRRIIYALVEKLFQIQIHHWQTGGSFMLR